MPVILTRELPKITRDMQCQYCFVAHSEEKPLRCCSQCKRSHYCTKECRSKDWKMHKKMCMNIMEARKQAKDPQRESAVKLAIGLTRSEGDNMMKRWVQFYRPLLMSMVKHALKLQIDEPLRDHYLYLKLVPKFTVASVPITDHDLINAFRAEDISVRSIKQLLIDTPDFKPMYDAVLEREKNMATQGQDHIICVVPVVISTPVFDNIRFAPFGVAGPKEYMDPYNLSWKQDLERGIEKAAPCGCRVCLHI